MEADPDLEEAKGGLQAPHVIRVDGVYYMFYGDWNRICYRIGTLKVAAPEIIREQGQEYIAALMPSLNHTFRGI